MKRAAWAVGFVLAVAGLASGETLDEQVVRLFQEGKYAEAEHLARQCLTQTIADHGEDHPDTATALSNLASICERQVRLEQAGSLHVLSLAIREKLLGPEHPSTATSLNNLATVYRSQGKYNQAEPLVKRALSIYEKELGPEHLSTVLSLNCLGSP